MPTPFRYGGRQHDNHANREWIDRSCVVEEPAHAEKQHAREPGDLLHVLVERSRPVREGHKPNGGHERSGEVGLRRSTSEPALVNKVVLESRFILNPQSGLETSR